MINNQVLRGFLDINLIKMVITFQIEKQGERANNHRKIEYIISPWMQLKYHKYKGNTGEEYGPFTGSICLHITL